MYCSGVHVLAFGEKGREEKRKGKREEAYTGDTDEFSHGTGTVADSLLSEDGAGYPVRHLVESVDHSDHVRRTMT